MAIKDIPPYDRMSPDHLLQSNARSQFWTDQSRLQGEDIASLKIIFPLWMQMDPHADRARFRARGEDGHEK